MKDNRGLSLIELIVTIAVMVLVSLCVVGFINTSLSTYRTARQEVDLQQESQLASNQLKDLVIDVNSEVCYAVETLGGKLYIISEGRDLTGETLTTPQEKHLYLYNLAEGETTPACIEICWKQDEEKLYYIERGTNPTAVATEYLMAEYVTDFTVDLSKVETTGQMEFTMLFSVNGREFKGNNVITLRNKVTVNNTTF